MISLILYGRNDNHGYNLHKRAAISLNAMAETLRHADDEVLFVDYNTPDDLPSFPEAIADTLTDTARARLRVLRVRPRLHAPYRAKTHLLALESISRNIALRRSNPANRWVLSTNTDMIFVPHDEGRALGDIVGELDDGFYQLPRFELPEVLWESFDRRDGVGMIARTREWARRFHLNEIVYGSPEILYDGPGDFQLCLRSDLIGMHGFHEGMLRGWHVDANLCARMKLLHGEIKSLADDLYAYHCDHTRQATAAHTHDRVENDADDYIKAVTDPQLPQQAESWGLPDEAIEEIRIGRADVSSRYLRALEEAIPEPQAQVYESAYRAETYGETTYRRAHVLPFVMDLVAPFPEGTRVLYAGARADTFADFLRAHRGLSGGARVLIPEEFDWLYGHGGASAIPLSDALEDADLLIFEFGAGEPGETFDRKAMSGRMAAVRRALIAAAACEQDRVGRRDRARRRVIAINAIHNEYESLVINYLAFTLTPFSSRVRHGFFLIEATSAEQTFDVRSVWRDVQKQTGRRRALPLWETQELTRLATAAASAANLPSEALSCADPLIAYLRHPNVAQAGALSSEAAAALAAQLEQARAGRRIFDMLARLPGREGARDPALSSLSRVADVADWEKPAFARFVDNHLGGARAYGFPDRNLWTWERAGVLDILHEAGALNSKSHVLLVTTVADALAPALADYVGRLEVARVSRDFEGVFIVPRTAADADQHGFEEALPYWSADAPQGQFDAIVFIQHAIMAHGPGQVSTALTEAGTLVKPGGVIVFSVDTCLNGPCEPNEFSATALLDGTFAKDLEHAGLEFCGPFEARLTLASCDRVTNHQRPDLRHRNMLRADGEHVATESLLTLRRNVQIGANAALDTEADPHVEPAALRHVMSAPPLQTAASDARRVLRRARSRMVQGAFSSAQGRALLTGIGIPSKLLQPEWTWCGAPEEWAARLVAKPGVIMRDGAFHVEEDFAGAHALYGPYLPLGAGDWLLHFRAEAAPGRHEALVVDVLQAQAVMADARFRAAELDGREHSLRFTSMAGLLFELARDMDLLAVETRFAPRNGAALKIWDVRLARA